MRDLFLTLFIIGMIPVSVMHPRIGLLIWAWIGYMSPHRLTWSYAFNARFVYWTALATLVGVVVSRNRGQRIPLTFTSVMWMAFTVWCTVTTFFALNQKMAWWEWERTMKIQLMILITFILIGDRKWLDRMIWVIVGSIGFWGLKGGVFTLLTAGNYRVYGPRGSFIEDNNTFALAIIVVFPLMRYVQLHTSNWMVRWGMWPVMAFSIMSAVGSYSRGGLVGLAVLGGYFWFKTPHRFLITLIMVVTLPMLYNFMPDHWRARMQTIETYEEDKSAMGRINAWHFAVNLAMERPLVGGGFQAFTKETFLVYAPRPLDYHDAHSIYFEVLAEQGVLGLAMYLLMYIGCFFEGTSVIRRSRGNPELRWARDLAAMIQVSLVGYGAAGAFLGLAYFDLPYHLVSIMIILRRVVLTWQPEHSRKEQVVAAVVAEQKMNSIFAEYCQTQARFERSEHSSPRDGSRDSVFEPRERAPLQEKRLQRARGESVFDVPGSGEDKTDGESVFGAARMENNPQPGQGRPGDSEPGVEHKTHIFVSAVGNYDRESIHQEGRRSSVKERVAAANNIFGNQGDR